MDRTSAQQPQGIDAAVCQDTRSGDLDDLLASAETFQAPDNFSLGSAVRRAACDVVDLPGDFRTN